MPWCVLVCSRRRQLPLTPLPWHPFPPQAVVPIGLSPPRVLPLRPWPIFPSLLPFPLPRTQGGGGTWMRTGEGPILGMSPPTVCATGMELLPKA